MTTNSAIRGLLYLLIGCLLANLALLAKMTTSTADRYHRSDAVSDFSTVNQRLTRMEANQRIFLLNQKVAMRKLGVAALEPTTQP